MQLKIFTAPQLHEALAQVREALGPDALILDREAESDGQGGKMWKVYAAIDQPAAEEPPVAPAPRYEEPDFLHTVSRLERLVDGLARKEAAGLRNSLESSGAKQAFDTLVGLGAASNYAYEMAADFANGTLSSSGLIKWGARLEPKKRREVVTLFGPTGSGKTLMAAKLATYFSLKGISVALLSLDAERIAANAQLAAYADILGIPFFAVRNEKEMDDVLSNGKASAQLLIVDSEGICCQRTRSLKRLSEQMERIPATRRFLVMPANMDEEDGMEMIRAAASLSPTDMVFSKLDETNRPGKVVNLAAASSLPLSYCSFGAEVPDHLGWLSPRSLMSLLSSREREALGRMHERAA